jgi:hypothetical protein
MTEQIVEKITKVTLEDFVKNTDWESKDKLFWKELFKDTHYWSYEERHWLFKEKQSEIWEGLIHLKYVPYYKEGKLYVSEAGTIAKLIKRLRYVMRGNSIPNYGINFKEVDSSWSTLTIGDMKFSRTFSPKDANKMTWVKDS